jgi:hypothetical protein
MKQSAVFCLCLAVVAGARARCTTVHLPVVLQVVGTDLVGLEAAAVPIRACQEITMSSVPNSMLHMSRTVQPIITQISTIEALDSGAVGFCLSDKYVCPYGQELSDPSCQCYVQTPVYVIEKSGDKAEFIDTYVSWLFGRVDSQRSTARVVTSYTAVEPTGPLKR